MREIAEGITLTGQTLLKRVDRNINTFINEYLGTNNIDYVKAQDTDSQYIELNQVVRKHTSENTSTESKVEFVDRWHKKYIAPRMKTETDNMQSEMNVYENRLKFVRDVISDNSIFLAKKRYVMQVWDEEGVRYTQPKMKVMGVESVKSSTPEFCKSKINEAIKILLNNTNDDLIDFVEKTKSEFMELDVEKIASPRGISDLTKWVQVEKYDSAFHDDIDGEETSKSGTPIHVKAALNYNKNIDKFSLNHKYQKIVNGDKIKFVYLHYPNPTSINSIAFDEELPKEFGLHKYVNYDIQWEKTFYNPVNQIAEIIGWEMEKSYGLF